MTSKGALNFKDFPLGFSLVLLFFPPVITGDPQQNILLDFYPMLFFAGILGTLFTIMNPGAHIVNFIYRNILKRKILKEFKIDNFSQHLIDKNLTTALRTPSISFETDKLIGIGYFLFILILACYKLAIDEGFVTMLKIPDELLWIPMLIIGIGIVLIIYKIRSMVFGIKIISHFHQIAMVTTLRLIYDMENLSVISQNYYSYHDAHVDRMKHSLVPFKKMISIKNIDEKHISESKFYELFDDLKLEEPSRLTGKIRWTSNQKKEFYWDWYQIFLDVSLENGVKIIDVLPWFNNARSFKADKESVKKLEDLINLRDWNSAKLMLFRLNISLGIFFATYRFDRI